MLGVKSPLSVARRLLPVVVALVTSIPAFTLAAPQADHVVLAVVDGPRHTEFLDEPGRPRIPVLDGTLIPGGAWITTFLNEGKTNTMPGHSSLLTGVRHDGIANDGTERPSEPTLFELVRKQQGATADAVWMIGGKDKVSALTHSTHPDYGVAYAASWEGFHRPDIQTVQSALGVLQTHRPVLTVVNLAGVDGAGHTGDWELYLESLSLADSALGVLWDGIQADSVLAGNTDLIITADHGRHDDAHGGFQNHGGTCPGCRTLPLVALGPDFDAGTTSALPRKQQDVAATIGWLLGLGMPVTEGYVMGEILSEPGLLAADETPAAPPVRLQLVPNPARGPMRAQVPGDWSGTGRMNVFDLQGGLVATGAARPGEAWEWNARRTTGGRVPAGVYWVRAHDDAGRSATARLVVLP